MKSRSTLILHLQKEPKRAVLCVGVVVVSLTLASLSLRDLASEDRISPGQGFALFCYGLAFFTGLYHTSNGLLLKTRIGQRFVKRHKLAVADVYDISNKNVSAVQALFCCLTGLTCCTYSCPRDILKTSHYISEAYAWFGAAYFFYDIWSMYKVYSAKGAQPPLNGVLVEKKHGFDQYLKDHAVIVAHHVFIGAFGFLVITYLRGGLGDCFFGFVYLMEASTPFVSLRSVLSKLGLKTSRLYVINGLVMVVTFFICRVIMFPYVIYLYGQSIGLDYIPAIKSLPTGCKISILILLLPQVYWFILMIRGATQVLTSRSTAKRKIPKN